jgi:predicted metal-dependent enzyme (double-stranded beta helix superfamily)
MRIPNRHIAKPVEPVKSVEKVVEVRNDNAAILAEVKRVMAENKAPVKWIFSMIRNDDGDLMQVIASAADTGTII